jgi:hypothetical protein
MIESKNTRRHVFYSGTYGPRQFLLDAKDIFALVSGSRILNRDCGNGVVCIEYPEGDGMKKTAIVPLVLGSILFLCSISISQTVYTGLIFQAEHLSFMPSASPKILDEDGREVYGSAYVDKGWVEKQGIVGYAKSLEEAKKNQRVAGNPLVIKALKAAGANNRDLIISSEDARKIRELAKNINFLDHAKVIIVVP